MENKKKLQDSELGNVAGGCLDPDNAHKFIHCKNCNHKFEDIYSSEKKVIEGGCNGMTVYKCPDCGKWLDNEGYVRED